ncbi:MAG: DUF362 domain-containing protein [Deltaproteobacteria bacterium]|nr:DUF362 domain-containing protein [Deltaproteobacteria bacterium]
MASELLFARFKPSNLEPRNSIGAKWERLLNHLDLAKVVAGRRTAIKMHLGGGHGFTTIHPLFVRKLVKKIKAAGAREVFITDSPGAVINAIDRGYTSEVVGCAIISNTGTADRYVYRHDITPPHLSLDHIELAGEIVDADALIDLSHVKAHGACGFGGASKNLSMGAVDGPTRERLHALEGGLTWEREKCNQCRACVDNCDTGAISLSDSGEWSVFYHHCRFCQHCVLICPEHAISLAGGAYDDFQRGMALTTNEVLKTFAPQYILFINFLTDITIFCDCWGMTTPRLVPDIGILAGQDIVAIEQATLDLVRSEDLIPGALPEHIKLAAETGAHLFERIHGKNPYVIVEQLEKLNQGSHEYKIKEID